MNEFLCAPVILFYHMKHLFSGPSFQAKFLLISTTNLSLIDLIPMFLGYSRILELNNFFFFCHNTRHAELLRSGIEYMPPALKVQSLNHWTTREVLELNILEKYIEGCWEDLGIV